MLTLNQKAWEEIHNMIQIKDIEEYLDWYALEYDAIAIPKETIIKFIQDRK